MPLDDGVARLERSAVTLSLWVGGVGLAALKGSVYLATGSVLVRASMFDSMGDVFSSLIMALTQWRVNDHSDMHRYPMGKGRFAPLGVLFFCAFMCSTMLTMALDSIQSLVKDESQEASANTALRRLMEEEPRLRWSYGPFWAGRLGTRRADEIIAKYGEDDEASSIDLLSTVLLGVCVCVKIFLYIWCRHVGRKRNSEIVAALAADHFNDTISNTMVITTMVVLCACQGTSVDGPLLAKVDPAVSFFLSLWIIRGWIQNAMEQFRILSDHRAEEADVEAINKAVEDALQGSPVEFKGTETEVYHVGDGCRVQLKLYPSPSNAETQHMATLFDKVEASVRSSHSDVQQVDVHLRHRLDKGNDKGNESFSWVKEYAK